MKKNLKKYQTPETKSVKVLAEGVILTGSPVQFTGNAEGFGNGGNVGGLFSPKAAQIAGSKSSKYQY